MKTHTKKIQLIQVDLAITIDEYNFVFLCNFESIFILKLNIFFCFNSLLIFNGENFHVLQHYFLFCNIRSSETIDLFSHWTGEWRVARQIFEPFTFSCFCGSTNQNAYEFVFFSIEISILLTTKSFKREI